jgi:hypothetical protein
MTTLHLRGFDSEEAAKARSREIAQASGYQSPNGYWFRWIQVGQNEWALELNPNEAAKLTEEEQARLVMVRTTPVQVQPTPVYRYMDAEYVDEFLKTGKIRISSFSAFSRHSNEALRDDREGWNILFLKGINSTSYTTTCHGMNSLILCTSLMGPWSQPKAFLGKKCFEITNPLLFAAAITSALGNCLRSVNGPCSYVPSRTIRDYRIEVDLADLAKQRGEQAVLELVAEVLQCTPMFRKPLVKKREYEYRFIWELESKAPEFLMVQVPSALKYCRRV